MYKKIRILGDYYMENNSLSLKAFLEKARERKRSRRGPVIVNKKTQRQIVFDEEVNRVFGKLERNIKGHSKYVNDVRELELDKRIIKQSSELHSDIYKYFMQINKRLDEIEMEIEKTSGANAASLKSQLNNIVDIQRGFGQKLDILDIIESKVKSGIEIISKKQE
jgi:hypothetical protein